MSESEAPATQGQCMKCGKPKQPHDHLCADCRGKSGVPLKKPATQGVHAGFEAKMLVLMESQDASLKTIKRVVLALGLLIILSAILNFIALASASSSSSY